MQQNIKVAYYTEKTDSVSQKSDGITKDVYNLHTNTPGSIVVSTSPRGLPHLSRIVGRFASLFQRIILSVRVLILDRSVDVHHFFLPRLVDSFLLRFAHKPIIFTSSSANFGYKSQQQFIKKALGKVKRYRYIVSASELDVKLLQSNGYNQTKVIYPASDAKFSEGEASIPGEYLKVLSASSPWNYRQFETKGIKLIIEALKKTIDVRINFLWRNYYYDEMIELVNKNGVYNSVSIINKIIDSKDYFRNTDVTIALFTEGLNTKAWPNSIIDSIAYHKPVIVLESMPIADLIRQYNAGVVIKPDVGELVKAFVAIKKNYNYLQKGATQLASVFTVDRYVNEYREIYTRLLS